MRVARSFSQPIGLRLISFLFLVLIVSTSGVAKRDMGVRHFGPMKKKSRVTSGNMSFRKEL